MADLVDAKAMDEVLAQIKGDGLRLTGPGGFLSELVKIQKQVLRDLARVATGQLPSQQQPGPSSR